MCAILGIAFQRGNKIKKDKPIWDALSKLFIYSQVRGRVSTGMAITHRKDTIVIKDKISGENFVTTKGYHQALRQNFSVMGGKDSAVYPPISVIGHCRFPTKGEPEDNHNNHPIISGKCVGVHNGGIGNDEDIWIKFGIEKQRRGRVDSEAIFGLIDYFIRNNSASHANTADAIIEASQFLSGGYACAMVNTRNPYCVFLFKNSMPCIIRHFYGLGFVAWASQVQFLDSAFTPEGEFGPYEDTTLPANSGMAIDLHRSFYQKFDLKTPGYQRRSYSR